MATKPKVIIGMPCKDYVQARTAHAVACMTIVSKGLVTDFLLRESCEIASARTWIVNEALKLGGTHLLFIDTDICPMAKEGETFNVVERMLTHKKPIVGVEYNMRKYPLQKVHTSHHQEWLDKESTTELYEAQFAGTGFMLIDLAMFKDPHFGIDENGKKTPWFSFGRDSQGALALGEDVWFCSMARDSGYTTWIDPTITVKHIGNHFY